MKFVDEYGRGSPLGVIKVLEAGPSSSSHQGLLFVLHHLHFLKMNMNAAETGLKQHSWLHGFALIVHDNGGHS